jgi:hypothetical protein
MPIKRPFLLYLRSRLNLGVSVAGACLIVLSLLFLRPYAAIPILVIVLAWAVLTGALFFSRRGAKEVVTEIEQDRLKKVREKIAGFAAIRDRISVLRIGDERIARAIELFLQESGTYLEKCRELSSYSPLANERIERVLEICQVFLGERDEDATDRRYRVEATTENGEDLGEKFARDIMECSTVIRDRVTEDLLGQSGEERLSIMKELEEKK